MKNLIKSRFILYFFSFIAGVFTFLPQALASVNNPTGSLRVSTNYDSSMTRFSDMNVFLTSLVDFALQFVGIIAIAAIIYGGFLMLTSGGDEEQHGKGLHVIMYSVIGIVVILGSYAIVNTISAFGTGTEGVEPEGTVEGGVEPGSLSGSSDNNRIIRAEISTTAAQGTVPMKATFTTTGSYDVSNNNIEYFNFPNASYSYLLKSDYYWKMGDDSIIMGILKDGKFYIGENTNTEMPVVVDKELQSKYNANGTCDSETLCIDTGSTNALFKKKVDSAIEHYNTLGELITNGEITPTESQAQAIVNGQSMVSAMQNNEYPVLLYGKEITYKSDNVDNLYNVLGSPSDGSAVIQLLDPGEGVSATILNPYGMNLGSSHEHVYTKGGNFSPTLYVVNDAGTPFNPADDLKAYKSVRLQVSYDNVDPNRVPPNAAFVYSQPKRNEDGTITVIFRNMSLTDQGSSIVEMLTDENHPLDNDPDYDTNGDGDSTNDNDVFYFEWDFDIKEDSNGDGNPTNDNDWVATDGIAYGSGDTFSDNDSSVGTMMTSAVYTYPAGTEKVQAKLKVKNLQTQDYDNVVREIIIPKPDEARTPSVTSLFTYSIEPGTKKVTFENRSLGDLGLEMEIGTEDNQGSVAGTVDEIYTEKNYSFEWDFDTKSEITSLSIQNENGDYIDAGGNTTTDDTNSYPQDGIRDNDINTVYSALGNDNQMTVHFPEDGKTYSVKLTSFQLKDDGGGKSAIYDERIIDVFIPTIPDPIPPIAAFTWEENNNELSFTNGSKYYSYETETYETITSIEDFDLYYDFDITIDTDGDGEKDNDHDLDLTDSDLSGSTPIESEIFNDYKDHKVKLTVVHKDSGVKDSVTRTVNKNKEQSHTPIASFSYSYVPIEAGTPTTVYFKDMTYIPDGSTNTSVVWDFDTSVDSNLNGNREDDNDTLSTNQNPPCSYQGEDPDGSYKCAYEFEGEYTVKITVTNIPYGTKDSYKATIKIVNIPTEDPTLDPIAAFTWEPVKVDNEYELRLTNRSKYFDALGDKIYKDLISTYSDDGSVAYEVFFDYDINKDTNGDGIKDNDADQSLTDAELGISYFLPDPIYDPNIFNDNKVHQVKMTVNELFSGRSNSVVQLVKKPTVEEITPDDPPPPIAAFIWEPQDNGDGFDLQITNMSKYYSFETNRYEDISGTEMESYYFSVYMDYDILNDDSNGDNHYDNDIDLEFDDNKLLNTFTLNSELYNDFKTHKTRLTVINLTTEKFDTVDHLVRKPAPDEIIPNEIPAPIAAFTWETDENEDGSTFLKFHHKSTYYSEQDSDFIRIEEIENYKIYYDFDTRIEDVTANGDGITDNDENYLFSTDADLSTPLEVDSEIFDDYKVHNVKLYVEDLTTGKVDMVIHPVKKLQPTNEIINAGFTYSYTPVISGEEIPVYFKDISNPEETTYFVIWDFDLNQDSDKNGDPADDDDSLESNINSPCIYEDMDDIRSYKCTFENTGNYAVKMTTLSEEGKITDESRGTIRLVEKPAPPTITPQNPIAAFTFQQNQQEDKKVYFANHAIGSDGNEIASEDIIWDFDMSYDSDGDGNQGNDNDKDSDSNDSFSVSTEGDYIVVTYKRYKKYNVKQTVNETINIDYEATKELTDTVVREVNLGPILDPLPPLPLFAYQKRGTLVSFVNKSSDGEGTLISPSLACAENENPLMHNCYMFKWYFDFQDPNQTPDIVGYGQNVQYEYDNSFQTHEAVLTIEGPENSGEPVKMTRTIHTEADSTSSLIRANIVATPKSGNAPLTVMFSSEGSRDDQGTITDIFWDLDGDGMPDGDISGEDITNITYTYNKPGHYRIGLAVQGPSGKSVAFTWIDVYGESPKPTILFEGESVRDDNIETYIGYVNTLINVQAVIEDPSKESNTEYEYKWNFDDPNVDEEDNTSSNMSASYTYKHTGLYNMEFEVKNMTTNLNGVAKRLVKILPAPPQAKIIAKDPNNASVISYENDKFYAGALDIATGRLDVIFDASKSLGAKKDADCNTQNCPLTKLTKFEWSFGDGETTTELNLETPVSHTFTKPGTYDVVLTVTDEEDAENKAIKKVFVADARKPVPVIKISPTHEKTGKMITFDATGSHSSNGRIVDYQWEVRKANTSETGVKMFGKIARKVFNAPNKYDVILIIRDIIGEETEVLLEEALDIESQPPVARLTFELSDPEIPNMFMFNATDSFDNDPDDNEFAYEWNFDDGTTEIDNEGITYHTYNNKGQYRASVTVYDSFGLSDTATVTVRVDSLLRAKIENISPRAGKAPLEVQFSGIGGYNRTSGIDDATISAYEWDFKDGTVITRSPNESDARTPTHTFMKEGKYDVTLTVYDSSDDSASNVYKIYVGKKDPSPIAIIERGTYEGFRTVPMLFNGFDSFTSEEVPDSDDGIQDLQYSWDFDDDTPIETSPTPEHTYVETGDYTVTLTVTDPSTLQTDQDTVDVEILTAKPHARFTANPSYGQSTLMVEFDASASTDPDDNIYQYLWKFGANSTITTTKNTIVHPFINNSSRPITYNVTLKVIDEDDLYDTYSLPITVLPGE